MNDSTITVLAIDDSQDILFAISAICDLEGWSCVTTTEGTEAKELIKSCCPDIVLVDYHMPRVDGIEVVKSIRSVNSSIPIVVLTIESSREVADRFIKAGADDFALKPIKPIDLVSRIKVHLRSAKQTAPQPKESAATQQSKKVADEADEYVKGISPITLSIIKSYLQNNPTYVTINQISDSCGVAYQTAYRYLIYLVEQGKVTVNSEYGHQGRPKQKYRWKSK